MKTIMILFLLMIKIISFNHPPSPELITVIEINRHGARTSKSLHPKSLVKLFGKEMILTPHGYRQQELLGKYIRERYIEKKHFLNKDYSRKKFHIYSTPIQRTVNSAIGFISGLYPNTKTRIIYQNQTIGLISDDTIPIIQNTQQKDEDTKEELSIEILSKKNDFFHRSNCKYKGESLKKRITSSYEQIFDLAYVNITECAIQLSQFTNIPIPSNNIGQINYEKYLSSIQGYLQSYLYHHGKSLENSSLSEEVIGYVKKTFINDKYGFRVIDSKYNRMLTSELFETILNKFTISIDDPNENGFNVYSAHDTTIMNIFMNLLRNDRLKDYARLSINDREYFDLLFPPFASVLLFELYKINGKYYVAIEYNGNRLQNDFKYLDNENIAQGFILFDDFKMMILQLIEKDYEKLICGGHSISNKSDEDKTKRRDNEDNSSVDEDISTDNNDENKEKNNIEEAEEDFDDEDEYKYMENINEKYPHFVSLYKEDNQI